MSPDEEASTTVDEVFPVANPDRPQAACALLLDTSQSMEGARMDALRDGLSAYRTFLAGDEEARQIVETCVVTFGDSAEVVHPFSGVDDMPEIELRASGATAMGAAIDIGIEQIEERKQYYKEQGIDYYRPFLVLITDGAPTDINAQNIAAYRTRIEEGVKAKKFNPLFFGTKGTDFRKLKEIAGTAGHVTGIDGARFEEFFRRLSSSLSEVKDSKPGDEVHFEDPTRKTDENPNPFAFEV
jgi:uncharacterized protein YegL